jgi:hypothetical protein
MKVYHTVNEYDKDGDLICESITLDIEGEKTNSTIRLSGIREMKELIECLESNIKEIEGNCYWNTPE